MTKEPFESQPKVETPESIPTVKNLDGLKLIKIYNNNHINTYGLTGFGMKYGIAKHGNNTWILR